MHRHCEMRIPRDGTYLHTLIGLLMVLIRMQSHFENKINHVVVYFILLFGLFIVWRSTIRYTRSYLRPCLILRTMHRYCKEKIFSDGTYFHALFELLIICISTIRRTRSYLCPSLILGSMHRNFEIK